jgi:chromosome segregation ATPase
MRAALEDTRKQITAGDKQLALLSDDHNRVRSNLSIVPTNSEHYKTYLEKFVALDKQIESQQKSLRELNATLQTQIREHDQWLAKLDAE